MPRKPAWGCGELPSTEDPGRGSVPRGALQKVVRTLCIRGVHASPPSIAPPPLTQRKESVSFSTRQKLAHGAVDSPGFFSIAANREAGVA